MQEGSTKGIAVIPGTAQSVHLAMDLPDPNISDIPDGFGMLGHPTRLGVDATDREIDDALYGNAPPGWSKLPIVHEAEIEIDKVDEAAAKLGFKVGDRVAPLVRRPGSTVWDDVGFSCYTGEDTYYERGINLLPGYGMEKISLDARYAVILPPGLYGFLVEPFSISEHVRRGAEEARRARFRVNHPNRPLRVTVLGSGQIGLMQTATYRLEGAEVTTVARREGPHIKQQLVEELGARYVPTEGKGLVEALSDVEPADVVVEATGSAQMAYDSMDPSILGKNGVLCLTSITGEQTPVSVADGAHVNLQWVLGNRNLIGVVNASHRDFLEAIRTMSVLHLQYPGWMEKLLTNRHVGMTDESIAAMMADLRVTDSNKIKVWMDLT